MKNYVMRFGSGDSRNFAGLSPTFLIFSVASTGATLSPPSITEIAATWGLYTFQWGTTTAIAFLADGATSGLSASNRYITGVLDPADRADEYGTTMIAIGNTLIFNTPANMGATLVAIGNTAIALGSSNVALGMTSVALGTTSVALGITSVAYGLANNTLETNQGVTLVAIGNTSIALGSTTNQALTNAGVTLVAVGNTAIALGSTNSQVIVNTGITLVAIGNTGIAIGLSTYAEVFGASSPLVGLIGSVGSTFGGSGTDPIDLFGYLKRLQENLEGNEVFTKNTGSLAILSRGSSTTLITKTIANSSSAVIKT